MYLSTWVTSMRGPSGGQRLPFLDCGLAACLGIRRETAYLLTSERLAPELLEKRLRTPEGRHGVHEPDVLPRLPLMRCNAQNAAAHTPVDAVAHPCPREKREWNAVFGEQPALIEQDRWQQRHFYVRQEHVFPSRFSR